MQVHIILILTDKEVYMSFKNVNVNVAGPNKSDIPMPNIKELAEELDGLHTVAHTGDYNDLENKPDIPTIPTVFDYLSSMRGSTEDRPVFENSEAIGYLYFDTTLGKPIWWNGTAWVDATGATV